MADLREHLYAFKFHNCSHQHAPGYRVLAAVEAGQIAASQYRLHRELLSERGAKHRYCGESCHAYIGRHR